MRSLRITRGTFGIADMNILGIGTEITECPRIGKMIEQHGELFLRRIFTDREIRNCQAKKRALEHFAAHWAAKEAIVKAIGIGCSSRICWTDIEIRSHSSGHTSVHVRGSAKDLTVERGIRDILLSIGHCRTYATAYAMALGQAQTSNTPVFESENRPNNP